MTDGGGYDNSSVGYLRGEDGEKKGSNIRRKRRRTKQKEKEVVVEEEEEAKENGEREGRGEEDVCPLAMIIAESHRTWKDRKNDSPSAVFSFAIARRERERARM